MIYGRWEDEFMGGGALTELSKKAFPGLREFCENLPRVAWVPLSKAASKPLCLSLLIPRYVLQLCMKMTGNIGKVDFVAPITECSIVLDVAKAYLTNCKYKHRDHRNIVLPVQILKTQVQTAATPR